MNILFDHQSFSRQAKGGVSRSFVELVRALNGFKDVHARILAPLHWNDYLCDSRNKKFCTGIHQNRGIFRLWHQRWWLNYLTTAVSSRFIVPDILHETWYSTIGYPLARRTKCAITIHDLIYQIHPEWTVDALKRSKQLAASLDRADVIFCVSEHTKNDLLNWRTSLNPDRVFTVYHGISNLGSTGDLDSEAHLNILSEGPYFLYVGQRASQNKNFPILAQAFAHSGLQNTFSLLCFGGGPFNDQEMSLFKQAGLRKDRILQVSGDDQLLRRAYQSATALVYPSLYEGFGLPVLEAMSLRCPVLSSNASCLPEIGGDACLYFSPTILDDAICALKHIAADSTFRDNLMIKGLRRCENFTLKKSAKSALKAYNSIL